MNLRTRLLILGAALAMLALAGCAASSLLAYTGGGLPPGEPDLGGIVVASVDSQIGTAQGPPAGTEPVVGAQVKLMRGRRLMGQTQTGEGGYFRFSAPDTGSYTLVVTPPANRPELEGTERMVAHTRGVRTFVTVELMRRQGR